MVSEYIVASGGERKTLLAKLQSASNYEDYVAKAKEMDKRLGLDEWKNKDRSAGYDWRTLQRLNRNLRHLRAERNYEELMVVLQGCVKSNFAGVENPMLYSQCYYGTKRLIEEYNSEVLSSINAIIDTDKVAADEKRIFFRIISRNYGKTALALSGGASFCYNHYGVLKALLENDLLPNIMSGTSGGGIIAALASTRTNKELLTLLTPKLAQRINAADGKKSWDWIKQWWTTGALFDSVTLARKAQWWTLGSTTFRESFERTGKILNIPTTPHEPHSPEILCNYITSPNCCIWSTLLASAAVPGVLKPVVLMEKDRKTHKIRPFSFGSRWQDGSLRTDIPLQSLNSYFNVQFTIVSQVNPHVLLWFYKNRGDIGRPVPRPRGKSYRGGFLPSYLENLIKLESLKWLKMIKDFQILPNFLDSDWSSVFLQRFDGTITLFPKIKVKDYFNLLGDPTEEQLAQLISNAELVTYPKLLFIKHRLGIERAIERGRKLNKNTTAGFSESESSTEEELNSSDLDSEYEEEISMGMRQRR
ncbi:hypothetical protein OGAPHI_006161 [Ogataea philodendri]|uniref:PNPLA domain-containing protein n=1 Tax=Ogataea philodendri TaxID=1378263 RepID=A0A9P8NYN3_9ASCO|nr:uncharacterized protein OGAPHI_006161 [Ogataea philodendri]KAH3661982.1 hypothetical protein OGAPHI_006161 [Ogataea philodendri]